MQPTYNPYAPPTTAIQPGAPGSGGFTAYVDGDKLVVQKEAPLPPVCLKCGAHGATERRRQRFVWNPPWLIVLVLISWLLGLIVMLIVQKKGALDLPLCVACAKRWKRGVLFFGLSAVGLLLSLVAGVVAAAASEPIFGVLVVILALAGFIVLVVKMRGRFISSTRVDDRLIWLRGVHLDALTAVIDASRGPHG